MAANSKRQIVEMSEADMKELADNSISDNTKKLTQLSVKMFRDYLLTKEMDTDFEGYEQEQLDQALARFYSEIRDKDGKKSTLCAYRQGLQRHLSSVRDDQIDIVKGDGFNSSARVYKGMVREMKKQGLGAVEHHPPISDADLDVLYKYLDTWRASDSAVVLQQKVFVDIMIHFGRRGRENLRNLHRDDFAVMRDGEGSLYVYKTRDELTTNHQADDDTKTDGRMYEIKESDRCPVRSFVSYLKRLNPKCWALFQKPRIAEKDGIYFDNVVMGHNLLGNMMKKISKAAGLSREYTNHSLRATTVHVLDVAQFPSRHIMSVTGHKSENSLKTYTGQTSEKTKKLMSAKLNEKTSGCRASTQTFSATSSSVTTGLTDQTLSLVSLTSSQEQILMDDLDHQSLNDGFNKLFSNFVDTVTSQPAAPGSTVSCTTAKSPLVPQMPTLNNCSNITFNSNINITK